MKKLIYCALALAASLLAASCQQENLEPVGGNTVTYTVQLPDVQTKAIGDGSNVNQLIYEVWRTKDSEDKTLQPGEKTELLYRVLDKQITNGFATIELDLVNDQNYTILFWAQVRDGKFYNTEDLRNVQLTEKESNAFEENRAAFYGVDFIKANEPRKAKQTVTLTRPFGQVNLGTEERTAEQQAVYELKVVKTAATVKGAATAFNVATEMASADNLVDLEFTSVSPLLTAKLNDEYQWISMNYIFVPANQATLEVDYTIETNHGFVTNTISNIPAKKNYRTNIVGNLLTSKTDYTVNLDASWTDSYNTTVIEEGIVLNANGDYEVSTAKGLAYAINKLWENEEDYYLTAAEYDMTGLNVTPVTIAAGKTLNIYGETPVVTRSSTSLAGITIKGLDSVIETIENGAVVSISGVTIETTDENPKVKLVNKVEEGASVVISECSVVDNATSESSDKMEDLIGEGYENVGDASKIDNLVDLQAALNSGVKEINLTKAINITNDEKVTIDLNGKTVRGVDSGTASYGLITNKGELIVNGPGVLQLSATENREWNAYSSVISNNPGGNLTVKEGAVIEHLGGTDMAYGIDNLTNGKGTSAVVTIEDATIKSTYTPVRQFLNGIEAINELYVNSGAKLISTTNYRSIYFQDPSAAANTGKLVVAEGAELYADVRLSVTAGSTEWPVEVSIASSALKDDATVTSSNVPATYSVVEENGVWTVKSNEAAIGENKYITFGAAVEAAKDGDTITLLNNVTLDDAVTIPAGVTLNGNGKQINGTIYAGGNLTFVGYTKVTAFSASYYNRTITIGEGACLEVTGTGRVTLGYGNTFNITGSIENAKTADKANVQPSLIIPGGISITGGNDATLNVTNAYVQLGNTSSKNSAANGTFTLNFTNSIAEFTNQLTFSDPTNGNNPTFAVNLSNSVLTTVAKFCVAAPNTTVTLDNSSIITDNNVRNSGTINLLNGSVLSGNTIQFGENGGNNGVINVDASSLTIKASSEGHAFDGKGVGSIKLVNGATANIDYVKDMILDIDSDCTLTSKKEINCMIPVAEGLTKHNKENKYYVSSAAGLKKMNEMFADQSAGRDAVLNLVNDIDFAGYTWTPVDSHADKKFEIAEINGNGHAISNLTINGQAMFNRFAGSGDVVVKDITFDNATVNSSSINTSIITGHTYQNVLLDNVDVKKSSITGGYKVAPLIGTVYNESSSAITASLKNCDIENVTVTATSYDFCTTGMVAFVYEGDNDSIIFENCTVTNVALKATPNGYTAHAAIYVNDANTDDCFNEAPGVTVSNVTFEAL